MNYEEMSVMLKALADPKRLKIIDLLSCGSLCACDILDHFDFTQPTLSHHMKVLEKVGIVLVTKDGTWHRYQLTESFIDQFMGSMMQLFSNDENCICNTLNCTCKGEKEDEKIRTI
ncbi:MULTISPECIES: ArsR/SmtB family transcription factor [Enterococcus]|uniref:Winged helix-turn-helix transcriptional regulator n=1 Tax=Candidatus Enterococcus murrayae TaxID=2815321 RepID=A0ABS3HNZ9_9ENTE|nr:metalloregulator ArsR/SmtB family transcription factor [Enterococcus sp. MJM16]MBO0454620.1 winged helix-turn-helix transcriptional regulator [Enterococcus sp. MJM16]